MCCGDSKYKVGPAAPSSEELARQLVELIRRGPKICPGMAQPKIPASAAAAMTVTGGSKKPTTQASTISRSLSAPRDEAGYVAEFRGLLAQRPDIVNQIFTDASIFGTSLASTLLLKACEYGCDGLVQAILDTPDFDIDLECRGTPQGQLALHETLAALVDPRTSKLRAGFDYGVHFEVGLVIIRTLVEQGHVNPRATVRVPGVDFTLVEENAYAAIPKGGGLNDAQRIQVHQALNAYMPPAPTATGLWGCCEAFWQACCCCYGEPKEAAVDSAS